MTVQHVSMTVEEFEEFISRPENLDRRFELINGDLIEVPSNSYSSEIAALIIGALVAFLRLHPLGRVTGEQGGYVIAGQLYAPDVAYISYAKQPRTVRKGFNTIPPDLVVEVISDPDNRQEQEVLRMKITNYLSIGIVVWVVDSDQRRVEVHRAGEPLLVVNEDDTLDGGDVLPGFLLPVRDIFPLEL